MTTTFSAGQFLTGASLMAAIAEVNKVTVVAKGSNQIVNNSSALVDDNDLLLAVAASTVYTFKAAVAFSSGATPDIKVVFTFPALASCMWGGVRLVTTAAAVTGDGDFGGYSSATSGTDAIAAAGTGGVQIMMINGRLAVSTNAGNLRLQWAQFVANPSDTTVYAGSWLEMVRV